MVSGTFVPVRIDLLFFLLNIEIKTLLFSFSSQVQKAFPTEATKQIHEKPGTHPKHENHVFSKHDEQRFLNQPRRQ